MLKQVDLKIQFKLFIQISFIHETKKSNNMKTKFFLIAMITFLSVSINSFAQDGKWSKRHPRRDQVNDRLMNQNKRIKEEVKEGDITKSQATDLRKRDRSIRMQERRMASGNDGHLTKEEQERLNRRENNVSRKIGK